jgi:hypothetical protein
LVLKYSLFFQPEGLTIVERAAADGRRAQRLEAWARERTRESMMEG